MMVTTPATWRPEILRRTLESFTRNLVGLGADHSVLLINVDPAPVGSPDRTQEVFDVAGAFFGNVVANTPAVPSFPLAVQRLWREAAAWSAHLGDGDSPFLHLEDDWLLLERVELAPLLRQFEDDPDLTSITFRAYNSMRAGRALLSPGLIRPSHAAKMAALMRADEDPEKSLRPWARVNQMLGLKPTLWPDDRVIVQDIGREWMRERCLRKNLENGNRLTTWMAKGPTP